MRTLLFVVIVVVIIAVVTALLDSLLYGLTENGFLTVLLVLGWQAVTLMVLAVNVPTIFEKVQSAIVRRVAVVSLVIALHACASSFGVYLLGNVRELFGVPI